MTERTTITVRPDVLARLWGLRQPREKVPEKKPGRGRPFSDIETMADLVERAAEALERERKGV